MYCLVKYIEDDILQIVQTKSLSEITKDELYWAPYKRMGYYEAKPLYYSNNRYNLEKKKKKLEHIAGVTESSKHLQMGAKDREPKPMKKSKSRNKNLKYKDKQPRNQNNESDNDYLPSSKEDSPKKGESSGIAKDLEADTKDNSKSIKKSGSINLRNKVNQHSIMCIETNNNNFSSLEGDNGFEKVTRKVINNNVEKNIEGENKKSNVVVNTKENTCVLSRNISQNKTEDVSKIKRSADKQQNLDKEKNTAVIENINTVKQTHKRHCCYFCKKLLYQLPRHWFNVHYKEVEVKEILLMHKDNPVRTKKMDDLRKKGDFEFNKQALDEKKIVTRESAIKNIKYIPCPSCLGYFSKDNLRHHKKRCSPHRNDRSLQGNSRKLSKYIHERASQSLRNHIASNMFQDEVSNHFLFDEIIILYGNYLCIKYTDSHLKNYIRAQLRLLGRFMMQIKIYDPNIKCCKDLMHPSHIDIIRKSIDTVAGLNNNTGIYEHPTNARTLSTEFKKILEVVQSECDKKEDDYLMKSTKSLSRLYNLEITPYINRVCKLSENKYRRTKRDISLPENNEIEQYLDYLLKKVSLHYSCLKKMYSFDSWHKLCKYVLVNLVVFNRKRPGETQRLEIEDYNQKESVSEKDIEILSEEEKLQAYKYVRVAFRGKLGNTTALLIDKYKILPAINMILKYRLKAGVHPDNRFLFAYPSNKDRNKTYDAYRCHRQLLVESGIKSASLTFTNLRKQFATQVAKSDPSREEELRISNYMSHDYNIHKRVYDQSTSLVDITKISKHLEATAKDETKKSDQNKNLRYQKQKNNENINDYSSSSSELDINYKKTGYSGKKRKLNENDDYMPSSASEDQDEEFDPIVQRYLGKFKQRKLWTSEEKATTRNYFQNELSMKCSADKAKIKKFKEEYADLMRSRSVAMINQWLEGEISRILRKEEGVNEKRPRYSTPEKEILRKSFEKHSLNGSEPSIEELQDLIDSNDVLKKRTPQSLLQKLKNFSKIKVPNSS